MENKMDCRGAGSLSRMGFFLSGWQKPGGYFITQQVGSDNHLELRQALFPGATKPFPNHTLQNNIAELEAQSFEIVFQEECFPTARYFDVGVVVYLAKIIVWEFPEFSVERCFPELCELHRQMEMQGSFKSKEHRFVFIARKC